MKETTLAWIQKGVAKNFRETKDLDCFNGAARHQISQLPLESEVKEAMCSPALLPSLNAQHRAKIDSLVDGPSELCR